MIAEKTKLIGDLPGQRTGRLTILADHITTDKGERKYLCRCECGEEKYILERTLRYGGALSCGCLRQEKMRQAVAHDLAGKVFGELTVLHRAEHQRKNGGIWWTCRCSCGSLYDVSGSLLVTGRRTHCAGKAHKRNYASSDISGQRFHRLTALYPTEMRGPRKSVVWHCRCDCGNEIDVSYNNLVHCNMKSCGCRKKEHDEKLGSYLTHVAGTSLDMVKSKKLPADNTTGYKGVYLIKGRYVAKIVFQKKAYYLGTYDNIEDAAAARQEAEVILFDGAAAFYEKWKARAEQDTEWAEKNPVRINVSRRHTHGLMVTYYPEI